MIGVEEPAPGVALLRMEGPRGNAIDEDWMDAFERALEEAASARALVVTGSERFFSVGLNLRDLPALSREEMQAFAARFHRFFLRFFELEKPVVAAVRGHAVAGGALLALACDWRVVATDARFGIRDASRDVGVPYPVVAVEIVRAALPAPQFPEALYGTRYQGGYGAVQDGWAHEFASADEVVDRAIAKAQKHAAKVPESFAATKRLARAPYVARIRHTWDAGEDPFVEVWFSDGAQERLRQVRSRLVGDGRAE